MELLCALDTSKANGPDNISAKMLKSTTVSIASVLTKLFWTVYMEFYVPDSTVFIVEFWQKFMRQLVELGTSNKTEENVSLTNCSAK